MSTEHDDPRNAQPETSDGDSSPREPADLPDFQERAREAPLTDEAKSHLRAAGSLADRNFVKMQSIIMAALEPIVEANLHVGADLTLTHQQSENIEAAVRAAFDYGATRVIQPIFARADGEKPYVTGPDPEASGGPGGERAAVRRLAHLAMTAAGVAHRLCPRGVEPVRDAVSALESEIEEAVEAVGIELDDAALDAVRDEVQERMLAEELEGGAA